MPQRTAQGKADNWKKKAILRAAELRALRKREKELVSSRDSWKQKYKQLQAANSVVPFSGATAGSHHYPLSLVWFCLQLQEYGGIGLRSCRHAVYCLYLTNGLQPKRLPSHTTIRNWACKCGLYRIYHTTAEQQDQQQWVVMVDESLTIGQQKLLLVLGVPCQQLPCRQPLRHAHMRVLAVEIAEHWPGHKIAELLESLARHYKLAYVVSDQGNTLKKAYALCQLPHVPDSTHYLAGLLKQLYGKCATMAQFCRLVTLVKRKWVLSVHAAYMPPVLRTKMRFANIYPVVEWASQLLQNWSSLPAAVRAELAWLKQKRAFLAELPKVVELCKQVSTLLKTGLDEATTAAICALVEQQQDDGKAASFARQVKQYLATLAGSQQQYGRLCVCSDVIESSFGKFKQKINTKSGYGISAFALTIASYGKPYQKQEVKVALETVQEKQLQQWKQEQDSKDSIVETKRKKLPKKWRKLPPTN